MLDSTTIVPVMCCDRTVSDSDDEEDEDEDIKDETREHVTSNESTIEPLIPSAPIAPMASLPPRPDGSINQMVRSRQPLGMQYDHHQIEDNSQFNDAFNSYPRHINVNFQETTQTQPIMQDQVRPSFASSPYANHQQNLIGWQNAVTTHASFDLGCYSTGAQFSSIPSTTSAYMPPPTQLPLLTLPLPTNASLPPLTVSDHSAPIVSDPFDGLPGRSLYEPGGPFSLMRIGCHDHSHHLHQPHGFSEYLGVTTDYSNHELAMKDEPHVR